MWYRIGIIKPHNVEYMVMSGELVPVEPDLKASFDMMRDQPVLSDWKDWQIEQWVKSIVDAALKDGA